jgi:hypothetical protein
MSSTSNTVEAIPPDDLRRNLTIAGSDEDKNSPHIGLVGDTYTILLTGKDTAGRYCLIDMHVPPGGQSRDEPGERLHAPPSMPPMLNMA